MDELVKVEQEKNDYNKKIQDIYSSLKITEQKDLNNFAQILNYFPQTLVGLEIFTQKLNETLKSLEDFLSIRCMDLNKIKNSLTYVKINHNDDDDSNIINKMGDIDKEELTKYKLQDFVDIIKDMGFSQIQELKCDDDETYNEILTTIEEKKNK